MEEWRWTARAAGAGAAYRPLRLTAYGLRAQTRREAATGEYAGVSPPPPPKIPTLLRFADCAAPTGYDCGS